MRSDKSYSPYVNSRSVLAFYALKIEKRPCVKVRMAGKRPVHVYVSVEPLLREKGLIFRECVLTSSKDTFL